MANNWNIPAWLENRYVSEISTVCIVVQNSRLQKFPKKTAASWEHIINDAKIITTENIALCCCGCNASKGQKQLSVWLETPYCQERGINPETVAPIIKEAITNGL